jgi:hypothetical protein
MKLSNYYIRTQILFTELHLRPSNFTSPWQKYKNISLLLLQSFRYSSRDEAFQSNPILLGIACQVSGFNRVCAAFTNYYWDIVHKLNNPFGVKGCRHDQYTQIRPQQALRLKAQSET